MILLDTHAWIWWVNGSSQLSNRAQVAISRAADAGRVFISSMSVWEAAMLVHKGRLRLTMPVRDRVSHSEALPHVTFVPVNNTIALNAVALKLHPDPADRIILATAFYLGASIVSKDEKLQAVPEMNVVW